MFVAAERNNPKRQPYENPGQQFLEELSCLLPCGGDWYPKFVSKGEHPLPAHLHHIREECPEVDAVQWIHHDGIGGVL